MLPQRDRDSLYANVFEKWTAYGPQEVTDVASPVVFSYSKEVYKDGMAVKQRYIGCIAEVEFSILALGAFLQTARSGPIKR